MKINKKLLKMIVIIGLQLLFTMCEVKGANTIVQFNINGINGPNGLAASFQVELFDTQTPITVANFLNYVTNHAYENTVIHRDSQDFVLQGGGYKIQGTSSEALPNSTTVIPLDTYPPIQNEPGISNLRGTIGMARFGYDLDSATSQWYFNLSDNTFLDDAEIYGGPWTVFGRILDPGMTVLDQINQTSTNIQIHDLTDNYGDAFRTTPLFSDDGNNFYFITIASIEIVPEPSILILLGTVAMGLLVCNCQRKH